MDTRELIHVVRESYPFPIAHAHKKTLAVSNNDVEKLRGILVTAEKSIQFLALLALAQVRQDLDNHTLPNAGKLREELKLADLTFGKCIWMAREAMKAYGNAKERLAVPELFDVFWKWDAERQKLCSQPLDNKAINPLRILRNDFAHNHIEDHQFPDLVPKALDLLHQFLDAIRFVADYQLLFTKQIVINPDQNDTFLNEFLLFTGCFSAFDPDLRKFEIRLKPEVVVFLHPHTGRHLILSPFITFTSQLFNKMPDLLVIDSLKGKDALYVSTLFGKMAKTSQPDWPDGAKHLAELNKFVEQLQQAADAAMPADLPPEEDAPAPVEDDAPIMRKAAAPTAAPHTQHANPYKFLDYYNPEDADIFFGRDREIRALEQKFHNTRLLVLHGESGTGKTSLIRAGLMPRLSPEVFVPAYVRVLHDPLREIKRALLHQLGLQDETLFDKPLTEFLTIVAERVSKTVIIVFDQFEEFFLRFDDETRRRVIAELAACLTEARLDVKFLFAIRSDYFAMLAEFEDALPQIFTHQIHLERLTEAQALEAVIKPAERLGIQVDEPMVQIKLLPALLAKDGGIEPPLLQIVCHELYQNAYKDERNVVDMRDYEAVGDVTGALGNYLNTKLREFGKHQPMARAVLKALITAEGTKRASFVPELCSRINSAGLNITDENLQQEYLNRFVEKRLVRVDDVEGAARYELSHDYLAKHIEAWIEESERELTKALELIDRAYETYQATRVLLERSALQALKPFEAQMALPPEKQAFLDRSKTETRKQRRGLWLKVAAALMAVALVVGGGFGYQAYLQYQEALRQKQEADKQTRIAQENEEEAKEQALEAKRQAGIATEKQAEAEQQTQLAVEQRNIAYSRQLSVQADTLWNDRFDLALLLSVEAFQHADTIEARRSLFTGVHAHRDTRLLSLLTGHTNDVQSVAFSPNGKLLASGSSDATIRLWDGKTGQPIGSPLKCKSDELVTSIAFSPDSKQIASVSSAYFGIRLWDVASGKSLFDWSFNQDPDGATTIAFSPDGKFIASNSGSGSDQNVWLFDAKTRKTVSTLSGHDGDVRSIAFSPDSKYLASGGDTIRLWDMTATQKVGIPLESPNRSDELVFSPNGNYLASANDKTIQVWEVKTGQLFRTLLNDAITIVILNQLCQLYAYNFNFGKSNFVV